MGSGAFSEYSLHMLPQRFRIHSSLSILLFFFGWVSPSLRGATAPDPTPVSAPSSLVIHELGKGTAPLDGLWQFHLGDDSGWAAPQVDDSHWEQISVDKPWGLQGHASYTGFGWYRRHVSIRPALGASPDLAIFIRGVADAYELYWNGQLVAKSGDFPPHAIWYFFQPPQNYGLGPVRDGVLAMRVWKAPLQSFDNGELGGLSEAPLVGSPAAIAATKDTWDFNWLRRRQFTFGLDSLYGLVALLSMLAWLRDRRQWLLFWMAGFAIGPILNLSLLGLPNGLPDSWSLGLAQPVFGITDISLWFLLVWLLQLNDSRWLNRLVRICAVIDITATSLDGLLSVLDWQTKWITQIQLGDAILTGIFTFLEALPLLLVAYAVFRRRKLDPTRWLVAIFSFTTEMISVVRIASQQGSRYTHWTLAAKISAPLFEINGNPITMVTLSETFLLIAIIFAVYRYLLENTRRQSALEQEFKNARELQQVLVPETMPPLPGFALTSAYRPAQEVGGDFFQIIPMEFGSTLIIMGDVSGKGLRAAMAVSLIVGAVRTLVEITNSPAEILSGLNRRLYGRLQGGFVTAVVMRLKSDGSFIIASAGHPAPFINESELSLPGALPLGLVPNAKYEETSTRLHVGDHFALYTDGLLEARSTSGELYGFDRLQTLFADKADAARATDAAVTFGQDDDITVVTLTRLATGQESTSVFTLPRMAHT